MINNALPLLHTTQIKPVKFRVRMLPSVDSSAWETVPPNYKSSAVTH